MRRAFTLIEAVITVALSVVLVLAIAQLYIVYGRAIEFQQSSIAITLGGSSIMDAARSAGLQARHVVASHTFSGIEHASGTTTAIFELPAVDASGAIIADTYDYVGIATSSTNAYQLVDAAAGSVRVSGQKKLTGNLNAISFTYDNQDFSLVKSITIDATTTAVVRGQAAQTHLREHVYLRNL